MGFYFSASHCLDNGVHLTTEARAAETMWQQGYLPANDSDCPGSAGYRRFCPNAPLRRASAAVMMSRALGLVE